MAVPTVADLKQHLNITRNDNDDELVDMLDAALDVVGGLIGPVGATATAETHYGLSSLMLILRRSPVSAVSSISTTYLGGPPAIVDPASYVLDPATGIVRMVTGFAFWGDVTVTYTAGSDDVPGAVRMATLIIAAHLWETQRGNTGGGPLATDLDNSFGVTPGAGFAIPNRAKELLEPYVQAPQIA